MRIIKGLITSLILFFVIIPSPPFMVARADGTEKQVREFLAQKKPCVVAFTYNLTNPVVCVWNGTYEPGTVQEDNGCYFGKYSILNNQYYPIEPYNAGIAIDATRKKACTKELVKQILFDTPLNQYISGGPSRTVVQEFKRQANKYNRLNVLYDEFGVLTPESIANVQQPAPRKIRLTSKNKLKCDSAFFNEQTAVECKSDDQIRVSYCNTNLSTEAKRIYKTIYKLRTGTELPKCENGMNSD